MSVRHAYLSPLTLLLAILAGACSGYFLGPKAQYLKPIGDIFVHLLLCIMVPLLFFGIAAAVAQVQQTTRWLKMMAIMLVVFVVMSVIAAGWMLITLQYFPLAASLPLTAPVMGMSPSLSVSDKITTLVTANNFSQLLSHENMLALIIFALLVGLATAQLGESAKKFGQCLQVASDVFFQVIHVVMYLAPIGFFAYFAVLVHNLGSASFVTYAKVTAIYYGSGLMYLAVLSSGYAYFAYGYQGFKTLWANLSWPAMTALATCSSAASIPANLQATKAMGLSPTVYETVVPLGSVLHKDGTVLGAVVKIVFLFSLFHLSFHGFAAYFSAIGVALLVGSVMGAIPGGGMIGEVLILSLYGFPPQALMLVAAISLLIDPLATVLNVTGNTVASLLVERFSGGKGDLG